MTDEAEALKPCPREPEIERLITETACLSRQLIKTRPRKLEAFELNSIADTVSRCGSALRKLTAAPKSLEIPREIAALRELVAAASNDDFSLREWWLNNGGDFDGFKGDVATMPDGDLLSLLRALAMYDQERR